MQINRDATNYTPPSFDALPSGWYPVQMVEGLETPSSTKPNTYYAAVFEVIDGPFKGRKLFANFNFNNTNAKAVEIAYDHLDQMMSATGVLKIQQMDQLFNKPMMAKVKLVPAVMEDDGESIKYDPKNELKAYKPLETGVTLAAGAGAESLPEGFTASVAQKPKPAAGAASAAVPKAAAPKEEAPVKKLVMTDKLPGVTAEQFRAEDPAWTDQALVDAGYAKWETAAPKAPAVPKTPSVPKAAVVSEAVAQEESGAQQEQSSAESEDDDTPPWLAEQQ